MANNIGGSIGQLFRGNDPGNIKTGKVAGKVNTSSKAGNDGKLQKAANPFGESAKVELSPEVEMYGKVVDLLQKKYDNADDAALLDVLKNFEATCEGYLTK